MTNFLVCGCCSMLLAVGQETMAEERLLALEKWVYKATELAPVTRTMIVDKRREMLTFLASKEGPPVAERLLFLLVRLREQQGIGPLAPAFPFAAEAARRYQKAYADWRGLPLTFVNRLGMTFVLVPPGAFKMGSPKDEPGHGRGGYDETLHPVTLSRPFYLCKHETTVAQFRRFVDAAKYETDGDKNGGGHAHDDKAIWKHRPGTSWRKPGFAGPYELKDDHPVVHVSHADSVEFARWLTEQAPAPMKKILVQGKSGLTYGLPTEAQWEWACRAGSGTRYWWGNDFDTTGKVANVGDRTLKKVHPFWPRDLMQMDDGHSFPAPVGSYQANAFGLCDMLGNVWEFCSTRSGPYALPTKDAATSPALKPVLDPGDLDPKRGFAVRGGGWSNDPLDARCATRNADPPHFCHSNLGFRLVLILP